MRAIGLLGFALWMVASLSAATKPAQPAAGPDTSVQTWVFNAPNVQVPDISVSVILPDDLAGDELGESGGICYKIRAYIFKRDDDHAPELIGSSTCGPRQAQLKDAGWPQPRLVPAD